jgi:hypothetical protein
MATLLAAPTSQKHRLVSFRLDGRAAGYPVSWFHLPIRPEDLDRREPSRAAVHQTLSPHSVIGWADIFGAGLPRLKISGHTGWNRNASTGLDGEESFKRLNAEVFTNFHQYRQQAVDAGKDPNLIKLVFVDDLDGFAYQVIPLDFTLRRSRARPLVFQYNIQMQAISRLPEVPHQPTPPLSPSSIQSAARTGMTSLEDTIARIAGFVDSVEATFESYVAEIAKPVHAFMNLTQAALQAAQSVETQILQKAASADAVKVAIAQDLSQSARNIFWTINGIRTLPQEIMHQNEVVAAAYNNAFCLFSNVLKPRSTYPLYNPLYGASNCSSTAGGSPISEYAATGVNTFEYVVPLQTGVSVSSGASNAISSFQHVDPVLHPMSLGEIGNLLNDVTNGIQGL